MSGPVAAWSGRRFDDTLEKADDLCEVGFTFQRNDFIYKKIDQKKWLAEILIPDEDKLKTGCKLKIHGYVYTKIGKKFWTIEKMSFL